MNKRSTKFYRKNEAEVMQRLGFKETKNSGAGWVEKEDGQSDKYICQLKSTDKMSISIKQNDLHILEQNAAVSHKTPVFAFQFLNTGETWVAITEAEFKAFKAYTEGLRESEKKPLLLSENYEQKHNEELDEREENVYNRNVSKSLLARQRYRETKAREAEKKEKEMKERMKERRKQCRKNFNSGE